MHDDDRQTRDRCAYGVAIGDRQVVRRVHQWGSMGSEREDLHHLHEQGILDDDGDLSLLSNTVTVEGPAGPTIESADLATGAVVIGHEEDRNAARSPALWYADSESGLEWESETEGARICHNVA